MSATLPLRRMVLYKHGVGHFTRQGTAQEQEIELSIRAAEVDDVLKSLTVLTLGGGQVLGVHYGTPRDKESRLAEIPIQLGDESSFFDLIGSLRGTAVILRLRGGDQRHGRIIGIELHPQGREFGATLALLSGPSDVEQIPTDQIMGMQITDGRAARDLAYYLDAGQSEDFRRSVTIALDSEDREVQISYTAPSPVWRVSYRFVGEARDGEADREGLLQGWAIFDNRLDEDLDDIEVVLVAGQPISFRYDLTSSVIPSRALVRDEGRLAPGPVEFAGTSASPAPAAMVADEPAGYSADPARDNLLRSHVRPTGLYRISREAPIQAAGLAEATAAAAESGELEELFEYRVSGVSLRRGESAMVPVVQQPCRYQREMVYNGSKFPRHPVVTARLRNTTGLTLERGPVTVVEDGEYHGEAMLSYTRRDADVLLAFAVELGVTITENRSQTRTMASIGIEGAYLHVQEHLRMEVLYTLVNSTVEEQVVTVEQVRSPDADLIDTRAPDEETGEHRRWRVACPQNSTTEFRVVERRELSRYESLTDQNLDALSRYLRDRALDSAARERLQEVVRLRQTLADLDGRTAELQEEQRNLLERQSALRKNLTIDPTSAQEQEIRRRSAEEFSRTQDRDESISAEIQRLTEERQAAESSLQTALAGLETS